MSAPSGDDLVEGEPRGVLREALLGLTTQRSDLPGGGLRLSGEIPPHLADPLMRALDRVSAEIQADDRCRGAAVRDGAQLQAAAFLALLLRVTDGPGESGAAG